MKKIYLILLAFLPIFSYAQFQPVNKTLINNLPVLSTNQTNPNARFASNPKACGEDTVRYVRYKSLYQGSNSFIGIQVSQGYSLGQYFDAPDSIEISGASFFAWGVHGTSAIVDLTVNLYAVGADTLPTGSPIRSATISVDTSFYGGTLDYRRELYKHVVFDSVFRTNQPYIIAIESNDTNRVGVVTTSYANGDGNGENIACGTVAGGWYRCLNLNIGGTQLDCDIAIDPHVSYKTYADFNVDACHDAFDSLTVTNTSSPYLFHRMYNRYVMANIARFNHRWNFGDTWSNFSGVQPKHLYVNAGNWDVRLISTLYGFSNNTPCIDTATYTTSYMPTPLGYTVDTPVCSGKDVEIATFTNASTFWYASPNAASSYLESDRIVTPALYSDTVFYAQAENGNCKSARVTIEVPVAQSPGIPVTLGDSICLNANGNLAASVDYGDIVWWDDPIAGAPIDTGNVFVTGPLTNNVTYYAEANNRGCISASRVAATVDVNANNAPDEPITDQDILVCLHDGDASLTAISPSGDDINWYTLPSGGNAFATGETYNYSPTALGSEFIYVEAYDGQCASSRLQKKVTTWTFPYKDIPSTDTLCKNETAILDFSDNFGNVRWYDSASGGNIVYDSNYFEISGLSSSTTFYLEPYSLSCADSMRHPLVINILERGVLSNIEGDQICANSSAELKATTDAGQITWADNPSMMPILGTGSTFNTAVLTSDAQYFVQTQNFECSGEIDSVDVKVDPAPSSAYNYQVNSAGNFTFVAVANGITYNWDFGDGNTGTGKSVTHQYRSNEEFDCVLTTTGSNACTSETTKTVKVSGVTGSVSQTELGQVHVYPNPNKGVFAVSIPNSNANYVVINNIGQRVAQGVLTPGENTVELKSEVSEGLYFLVISGDTYKTTKKLIVQ